ncbi:hypothetical protein N7494_010052 [Penicillium frequentans]|uniref:CBM-cenC domain-containing protein n=1 Tax=Penicillium frequentans TaxID=3151616 RepID=A0AAD6CR52_9EURO|nr:hypothetical protein N7494_010052 [Penicillium glabrum]
MMRRLGLTITSVSWIHAALVTSQIVSCTDDVTNLVTNPEFDSGLTGWSTYGNNWAAVSPSSSSDGMAYAENVITSGNSFYVYQTVSGYDIGEEYTVSVDARLAVGSGATTTQCIFEVLIHMNGGSYTVQQSTFSITSSSSSWQTLSGTFKPTYSSITLYALAYCQSGTSTNAQGQFRDVQFGQTTSVCTTSTPTSTPISTPSSTLTTPSSKAVQSSSAKASSFPKIEPSSQLPSTSSSAALGHSSSTVVLSSLPGSQSPSLTSSPDLSTSSPIRSTPLKSSSSPGSLKFTPSGNRSNTASSSQPAIVSPTSVAAPSASVPAGSSLDHSHSISTSIRPSSAPAHSSPVTGTTIQTTALVSGAHTASLSSQETQSLSHSSDITSQHTLSEIPVGSTTSTVFTTRTATITACPTSVHYCPAKDRTTYVTTETIVLSTTVCPITAEETATQTTSSHELPSLTTSTVLSTRTAKITACPSGVTKCPVASQSTYVTTETIVVSTTVCPITAAEATASPTIYTAVNISPATASSKIFPALSEESTTETLLVATTRTITACPSTVTDCPASQKSTYTTIETFIATVTVSLSTNTPGLLTSPSETTAEIIAQSSTTQTLQEQSGSAANSSKFPYSTPAVSARNSSHSFLTSTSSSAATEASNPAYGNSATTVSSASQVPGMTTTSPGSVYTGSASAIRSEWTRIVGALFLVMFV